MGTTLIDLEKSIIEEKIDTKGVFLINKYKEIAKSLRKYIEANLTENFEEQNKQSVIKQFIDSNRKTDKNLRFLLKSRREALQKKNDYLNTIENIVT